MNRRSRRLLYAAVAVGAAAAVARALNRPVAHEPDDDLSVPDDVIRHVIDTADGARLHAVERGQGRPLVLLHGITLAAEIWAYQLRDLSDRFRVIACDLRGHGASSVGRDGFGLDRLGRDLATVLETLDLRDAVLIGHSMGGMTVMRFCGDHPEVLADRVAGVVFLSTSPHAVVPRPVALFGRRVSSLAFVDGHLRVPLDAVRRMPVVPPFAVRRAFGPQPVGAHVAHLHQIVSSTAPASILASGYGILHHDAAEALAATHTPALVVVGSHDLITPPALSREIAAALPNARLVTFPDAGHQLMLERRGELNSLLTEFADEVAGVITAVPGVRVGHWTDERARTGCTVVLLPEGTIASGEVRGGAPATRETELLHPTRLVPGIDAVLLTGGSAFGLAAADGVVRWCEERGIGFPTAGGPVPIVVALGLFDLTVGDGSVRPGPAEGYAACEAATTSLPETGSVGAGTGATVDKVLGTDHRRPGGLVHASVADEHGLVVAALVAVNAFGRVISSDDDPLGTGIPADHPFGSTTIGVVATNAQLDKVGCHLVAQSAHDGLARAVVPAHTRVDGDAFVVAAVGGVEAEVDRVRRAAAHVVASAISGLAE